MSTKWTHKGVEIEFDAQASNPTFIANIGDKIVRAPSLDAMKKKFDDSRSSKFAPFKALVSAGEAPGYREVTVTGVERARGRKNSWSNPDKLIYKDPGCTYGTKIKTDRSVYEDTADNRARLTDLLRLVNEERAFNDKLRSERSLHQGLMTMRKAEEFT